MMVPTTRKGTPVATAKPASTPRQIADKAVSLAADQAGDRHKARATLIGLAGDVAIPLEQARELLVRRISTRSDDFPATAGLSLLNGTLSQVGKVDDLEWQPKVWRLPR
jgi:hypothetical protein